MKSTIKIDYESQDMIPIIRITQPFYREIGSGKTPAPGVNEIYNEDDEDVRDKLVRNFLHSSSKVHRYGYFKLDTYYPYTNGDITTIRPVQDLTEEFKDRVRITIENLGKEAFRKIGPGAAYSYDAVKRDLAKAEEFFEWFKEFDQADIWKEYTDENGKLLTDIFFENNPKDLNLIYKDK